MTDPAVEIPLSAPESERSDLESRREALRAILGAAAVSELPVLLADYHATEIAELLAECTIETQLGTLRALDPEIGTAIFDHLDADEQAPIIAKFRDWRAAQYLEEMAPDERADLFAELPEPLSKRLMSLLPAEEQQDVRDLLTHPEHTAGGLMTSEYAWTTPDATIADVLRAIRENFGDVEMIYYIYVVDEEKKLVGLLTLRYVLLADPAARVGDVMHTHVLRLRADVDQEIVAQELALYDFVAMPIVDERDRMLGIVTFDDVVDVLESEAVEDQELFGGLSPSRDDYIDQTIWQGVKQRLPWLSLFLVLSSFSGFIVERFMMHHAFGQTVARQAGFFAGVMALLPMITAMAGNAATQTATLVIRSLTIRDIRGRDIGRVLSRELLLGLSMGVGLAVLAFGRAWLTAEFEPFLLGLAVGSSVLLVMGISTVVGGALPMLFQAMRLDPAVMSSPFIATLIDIITVLLYFQVSILFLHAWTGA